MIFKRKEKPETYTKEREITWRGIPFLLRLDQSYHLENNKESLAVRIVNNKTHDEWAAAIKVEKEVLPFTYSNLHLLACDLNKLTDDSVSVPDIYNFIREEYLAQGVKYTFGHVREFFK